MPGVVELDEFLAALRAWTPPGGWSDRRWTDGDGPYGGQGRPAAFDVSKELLVSLMGGTFGLP